MTETLNVKQSLNGMRMGLRRSDTHIGRSWL